jgi:Tfp pilus assembly pilus retraction ATPase PilT
MHAATNVTELDFADLYLGHPGLTARFSSAPGADAAPLPVNSPLQDDLDRLVAKCREAWNAAPSATQFVVSHADTRYRVGVIPAQAGPAFVLRRIAGVISPLAELGMPQAYLRQLMAKNLSGLLLISGAGSSGKTATACALARERLIAHGGVTVTMEDPIELPLEGAHGRGICLQTVRPREGADLAHAVRNAMHCGASTIMLDELCDADSAATAIHASLSGNLVIATMLADGLIQTVTRLHALVERVLGPGSAQSLMGDGLLGVLHQHLSRGPKPKLGAEFLFFKDAPGSRAVLRDGKYGLLASDIKQQMAAMLGEHAVNRRNVGT